MGQDLTRLQPNTVVTVYHGTRMLHVPALINGFDANKVTKRDYQPRGYRHAGLFVAPDINTAAGFGSDVILEIKVKAKFLHGTDYSGHLGRHESEEHLEWLAEKYPNSFRPSLTWSLLQTGEPQAILRGLVRPNQITRVRYKEDGSAKWYTRKQFLALGPEVYSPYGSKKIKDIGYDLAYPGYSVDEFYEAIGAAAGRPADKVKALYESIAGKSMDRATRWVEDLMDKVGFGPTAIKSFLYKLKKQEAASRVARRWLRRTAGMRA